MKKTRIIIPYWALDLGGIQTRIIAIVEALFFLYPNIEIFILLKRKTSYDLKLKAHKNLTIFYYSKAVYKGEQLRFALWLLKTVLYLRPTHLLGFMNRFSFLVVLARYLSLLTFNSPKTILSEEIYTSNYLKQKEKWYWKSIVIAAYRMADRVLVLTKAMRDDLVVNFRVPSRKIRIMSSWVVVNDELLKIKLDKKYFAIFAGRLSEEKRLEMVLNVAKKIKKNGSSSSIAVAGDGYLKKWLLKEIESNKLESAVEYLGYRTDILSLMSKSRILLLPSKNEGLPMVILEANSVGTPVVVSNFMGARELVKNGINGWVVEDDRYVDKVIELIDEKKFLEKVGISATKLMKKNYSVKNLVLFVRMIIE